MPFMQVFGAFFSSETVWILIPLTALMIPIIAILIHHQQRMAQIVHGRGINPELENEVRALRQEVQQLRQMMTYQNIPHEMAGTPAMVPPPPSVAMAPGLPIDR